MKNKLSKKKKILILLALTFLVFVFNIWLINHGSGFTVPREMLFRNYAPLWRPLLTFPLVLTALFLLDKLYFRTKKQISPKAKKILLIAFLFLSSFGLFFTVQTNPDYGLYQREAKYFVENGLKAFWTNWGSFSCYFNMPLISFFRGITYWLFGEGQGTILLGNLFFVAGIFFFTYQVGRRLFNRQIALTALVFLATAPFFITQTPLFLVDLGLTFFVAASVYLLLKLIDKPSWGLSLLTGLVLFAAAISKVFGVVYLAFILAGFILFLILEKKDKKAWAAFFFSWLVMLVLSLGYAAFKRPLFEQMLPRALNPKTLLSLAAPLFLILTGAIFYRRKKEAMGRFFKKIYPYFLPLTYLLLIFLFFFGRRTLFYLRTTIIATSLPLAFLFFASFYFVFKKKSSAGFLLLICFWAVMAVPNTMFKYQLPVYPAIMLLASFSLFSLFKESRQRRNYLLVVLAFSFTITYAFFLPMINTHVKNNLRQAARFINNQRIESLVITPYPVGEHGEMFVRSLENPASCPHPPSLVDIIDFYTPAKVDYLPRDLLLAKLKSGQNLPEAIFLVYHLDLPLSEDEELEALLAKYYQEGPLFDQAKGSGIWRVKIKVFSRLGQ